MRTMLFGAGAVGPYYGASLAAAGQPVVFVVRDEDDRSALRARGLSVPVNARLHRLLDEKPRFTYYINPAPFIGS